MTAVCKSFLKLKIKISFLKIKIQIKKHISLIRIYAKLIFVKEYSLLLLRGAKMTEIKTELNVFLTGVTGLIGRHVMYELLKKYAEEHNPGKIYVLIRNSKNADCNQRLHDLLTHQYLPNYLKKYDTEFLKSFITCIEGDLCDENLKDTISRNIGKEDKVYVIHSAASTNLFIDEKAKNDVIDVNYNGSKNLFDAFCDHKIKFSYVSTAFSCGIQGGTIKDNHTDIDIETRDFRNPYEKYKLIFEKELKAYCLASGIDYQILRPSIVCGRLLDSPSYFTSKFDTIYGASKVFYRFFKKNSKDKLRLNVDPDTKLNIVPADYVGKAIARAFSTDIKELNIVHYKSVSSTHLLSNLVELTGFKNYELVYEMATDFNRSEKFYYSTAGLVFDPYFNAPENEYDTTLLSSIMSDVKLPLIEDHLDKIIGFAVEHEFADIG